jgi:NAD(P)-dependent dehydrogenase (short-subunit alcohol dehydrogenase family)
MGAGERKSIFITGAASGMERETALLFGERGWFVGGYDVDEDGLKTLEQELGAGNCLVRRLDVTNKEAYDAAVAEFGAATGGRLDLLFNNAGIGHAGWFEDVPYEDTMRLIQVNFIGVVNGIYAALPLLKNTPNSLCFTTSSSAATYGAPRLAIYAATKFAIKGLTEALSLEFERHDAPAEGPFRLMPARSVAECVWQAYHSNKLHWYVPPEIEDLDRAKAAGAEAVRARMREMAARRLRPADPD